MIEFIVWTPRRGNSYISEIFSGLMMVLFEKELRGFDFFEIIGVKGLSLNMEGFIIDLGAHTSMSLLIWLE